MIATVVISRVYEVTTDGYKGTLQEKYEQAKKWALSQYDEERELIPIEDFVSATVKEEDLYSTQWGWSDVVNALSDDEREIYDSLSQEVKDELILEHSANIGDKIGDTVAMGDTNMFHNILDDLREDIMNRKEETGLDTNIFNDYRRMIDEKIGDIMDLHGEPLDGDQVTELGRYFVEQLCKRNGEEGQISELLKGGGD